MICLMNMIPMMGGPGPRSVVAQLVAAESDGFVGRRRGEAMRARGARVRVVRVRDAWGVWVVPLLVVGGVAGSHVTWTLEPREAIGSAGLAGLAGSEGSRGGSRAWRGVMALEHDPEHRRADRARVDRLPGERGGGEKGVEKGDVGDLGEVARFGRRGGRRGLLQGAAADADEVAADEVAADAGAGLGWGATALNGMLRSYGYFYATIGLGTPPQRFTVITDTGSTVTYVPSQECQACGDHTDPKFNVSASSSYAEVACSSAKCVSPSPACSDAAVGSAGRCGYKRAYQEGSQQHGYMVSETLTLGDPGKIRADPNGSDTDWGYDSRPLVVPDMTVGLDTYETNMIKTQMADGIMGLGKSDYGIVQQFYAAGAIPSRTVVVCYGNPFRTYWGMEKPNLGVLSIGDHPQVLDWSQPEGPVTWTKSIGGTAFHRVQATGMTVGSTRVLAGSPLWNKPVVIDSGTTFTYVPNDALKEIVAALKAHHAALGHAEVAGPVKGDVCWAGMEEVEVDEIEAMWPKISFTFSDGKKIFLGMHQYTFLGNDATFCVGLFGTVNSWLFGGIMHRDLFVVMAQDDDRIGFLDAPCTELVVDPADLKPTPPPTPRPPTPAPTPGPTRAPTPSPPDSGAPPPDSGPASGSSYAGVLLGALIFLGCGGGLAYLAYLYAVRNGPSRMDETAEFLPAEAFSSSDYQVELGSVPRNGTRPVSAATRASPGVFSLASDSDSDA